MFDSGHLPSETARADTRNIGSHNGRAHPLRRDPSLSGYRAKTHVHSQHPTPRDAMPRRDARRARDAGRRAPGIAAAALIFAVCGAFLPGALAAPFASHTALWTAVRNCLAAVPSGLNCCSSGGANCGAAGSDDMPDWDTSLVTDMSGMFYNCDGLSGYNLAVCAEYAGYGYLYGDSSFNSKTFNQNISKWNTSSVTTMFKMFEGAAAFNQPIGDWDTSSVTTMQYMFYDAAAFNQPIGDWDTSSVTTMKGMFWKAASFNQPIGDWDTSSVTTVTLMFYDAEAFNQPIGDWDTSSVTDMNFTFMEANAFNQPIGDWDTSQVTSMSYMFRKAASFNQYIGDWDTSKVTNMWFMFYMAFSFNQYIVDWDTSALRNSSDMFKYASDWLARYTNCGDDNSTSECGEFTAAGNSFDASGGSTDGPPGAWVRKENACDAAYGHQVGGSVDQKKVGGSAGNCTDTLASGSSCTPTCADGYTFLGATSCVNRTLTRSCFWGKPCEIAPIANGDMGNCSRHGQQLPSGMSCKPTCDVGFFGCYSERHGKVVSTVIDFYSDTCVSTCEEGVLTATTTCERIPCTPEAPGNGTLGDCPGQLRSGESCQPTCDEGFNLTRHASCLSGTFTTALCQPVPAPNVTEGCKCSCCAGNYCEKSVVGSYDAGTASDCDAAGCRTNFPTECPSSGSSGSVSASYTSSSTVVATPVPGSCADVCSDDAKVYMGKCGWFTRKNDKRWCTLLGVEVCCASDSSADCCLLDEGRVAGVAIANASVLAISLSCTAFCYFSKSCCFKYRRKQNPPAVM